METEQFESAGNEGGQSGTTEVTPGSGAAPETAPQVGTASGEPAANPQVSHQVRDDQTPGPPAMGTDTLASEDQADGRTVPAGLPDPAVMRDSGRPDLAMAPEDAQRFREEQQRAEEQHRTGQEED